MAYFLSNELKAKVLAEQVNAVITALYDAGVVVRSLTSDGTTTNTSTYRKLGCQFDVNEWEHFESYFSHPWDSIETIYCIFYPYHMIKLCRNSMGETDLRKVGNLFYLNMFGGSMKFNKLLILNWRTN